MSVSWGGECGIQDPTVADAVLDRLIHDAYPLVLKGESLRKKNSPSDRPNLPSVPPAVSHFD